MKTFDKKDVYSWANCEDAKQYIGKEGYFADNLETLESRIINNENNELSSINPKNDVDFIFYFKIEDDLCCSGLFLPADKVKEVEEEKILRPFRTSHEFQKYLKVKFGDTVKFRVTKHDFYYQAIFNGYKNINDKLVLISLGGFLLAPSELFEDYEFYDEYTKEWRTFGVEE